MIPARLGSQRIPKKNIRYLNGKPLIMYPIDNCINCRVSIKYRYKQGFYISVFKGSYLRLCNNGQSDLPFTAYGNA